MTRYGRKRRRTLAWFSEHPRAFEDAVAAHDRAELDRFLAEELAREPADDPGEQARADRWLTDSDDFKSAA